jgi:hypothetical protein
MKNVPSMVLYVVTAQLVIDMDQSALLTYLNRLTAPFYRTNSFLHRHAFQRLREASVSVAGALRHNIAILEAR